MPDRLLSLIVVAMGLAAAAVLPALAQLDESFMPKGGRTLLVEMLGQAPASDEVGRIVGTEAGEEEWRKTVEPRAAGLDDRELRTLAAYLAVNMPLDETRQEELRAGADLKSVLPRDGRQLAWQECQYCHSLFSSHLTQDREVQAWRNMFVSPFHREMKMTEQEREEFARYSAINMPMKYEDVPEDLRF